MKLIKRLRRFLEIIKENKSTSKDSEIERHRSENALVEIELRDK